MMSRIALFTSLFLGFTTLVAVPAVITAAPASALACLATQHVDTDPTGQQFCAPNVAGNPPGSSSGPVPGIVCWNGVTVPSTSACPGTPTVPAPISSAPWIFCWNGETVTSTSACPGTPTLPAPISSAPWIFCWNGETVTSTTACPGAPSFPGVSAPATGSSGVSSNPYSVGCGWSILQEVGGVNCVFPPTTLNPATGCLLGQGPDHVPIPPAAFGLGVDAGTSIAEPLVYPVYSPCSKSFITRISVDAVLSNPQKIQIDAEGKFAYVANSADNTITKFTLTKGDGISLPTATSICNETHTVTVRGRDYVRCNNIRVGSNPVDIALSKDGNYAYVANRGSASISQISLVTEREIDTFTVSALPEHLILNTAGTKLFVTYNSSDTLTVINLQNRTSRAVKLPSSYPTSLLLNQDNSSLYVSDSATSSIYRFDLINETKTAEVNLPQPSVRAITNKNKDHIFLITSGIAPKLVSIALESFGSAPPQQWDLPAPASDLIASPTDKYIFISSSDSGTVTRINTQTSEILQDSSIPRITAMSMYPDGSHYLAATGGGLLTIQHVGSQIEGILQSSLGRVSSSIEIRTYRVTNYTQKASTGSASTGPARDKIFTRLIAAPAGIILPSTPESHTVDVSAGNNGFFDTTTVYTSHQPLNNGGWTGGIVAGDYTFLAWASRDSTELLPSAEDATETFTVTVAGAPNEVRVASSNQRLLSLASSGERVDLEFYSNGTKTGLLPGESITVLAETATVSSRGAETTTAGTQLVITNMTNTIQDWYDLTITPVHNQVGSITIQGGGNLATSLAPVHLSVSDRPPMSISSLSVSHGFESGGDTVTVRGVSLDQLSKVIFSRVFIIPTIVDSSTATFITPPGRGTIPVGFLNTAGNVSGFSGFSYASDETWSNSGLQFDYIPNPKLISVSSGNNYANTVITLTGDHFTDVRGITIHGTNVTTYEILDTHTIRLTIPSTIPLGIGEIALRNSERSFNTRYFIILLAPEPPPSAPPSAPAPTSAVATFTAPPPPSPVVTPVLITTKIEPETKTIDVAPKSESSTAGTPIHSETETTLLSMPPKPPTSEAIAIAPLIVTSSPVDTSQETSSPAPLVFSAPVVKAPVVKAPVVKAPVVKAPVVKAPVVKAPVTTPSAPTSPKSSQFNQSQSAQITQPTTTQTTKPTSAPTTLDKPKPITIACAKGNVIKKITSTAPKCPAGYKLIK